MTLTLQDAPAEGLTAVRKFVPPLLTGDGQNSAAFSVARPHPVYHGSIASVIAGKLLANVQRKAWQYLVLNGEQVAGFAEVADDGGSNVEYTSFHHGAYARNLIDGLSEAEQMTEANDAYELRIFRIPSLHVYAVWLHAGENAHVLPPGADLLLPIAPMPSPLEPKEWYSPIEMSDALKPFAEVSLAQADPNLV